MLTETLTQPVGLAEVTLNFRAMNTAIELLIYPEASQVDRAIATSHQIEQLFADTEAALSRFRPESELSQLNRQGYLENASAVLYENVASACQMRKLTGGVFDPTILDALEAAGYDRSFEQLGKGAPRLFTPRQDQSFASWRNPAFPQVELDPLTHSIRLAPGVRLDLGGIAKGSTVDAAAKLLSEAGFTSFMISAGGDMYLRGCPPQNSQGWQVGVANEAPGFGGDITQLLVSDKAVATSATTGRRWSVGHQIRHHLIDPRTRQPSDNGLAAVTVVANTVQMADVMAKTALILGPAETAQTHLKQKAELAAILFVTLDGQLIEL